MRGSWVILGAVIFLGSAALLVSPKGATAAEKAGTGSSPRTSLRALAPNSKVDFSRVFYGGTMAPVTVEVPAARSPDRCKPAV
ncbi:MAG TPA: hypothetical protein VFK78_09670 [Gemmatimonadales bacterium]|nr:hypothetical protein [Gemmatimonadales bacterium]